MAVPIFASLTALFFILAAVMGGLYIAKSGAYDKKVADVKSRNTKISSQDSQIDGLNKQISSLKDQLDSAGQKQSGTQSQLDEVTKEKQVIGNCLSLLEQALTFAANGDKANATATANKAQQPCDEAGKYIQ
jgi:chromosome segregation ATPase